MPHRAQRSQWAAGVWRSHCLLQMARALTMKGMVNLLSGLSRSRLVCHTRGMSRPLTDCYKNHRLPAEIIRHGVWLYVRFCLSYRDVEALLLARA
jgi:hypothetical protein